MFGMHLGFVWDAFGMHLGCIWDDLDVECMEWDQSWMGYISDGISKVEVGSTLR